MSLTAVTLAKIRSQIAAGSTLLAEKLAAQPPGQAGFADLLAAAAACEDPGDNYCFALEYIFEGYLLHYRKGRLLKPATPELNLLAGDYMYARGLTRLAALEDLFCVRLMADLVSLCSYLHCQDQPSRQTFSAWTMATVCLAGRAAGRLDNDECLGSFKRFRSSMLSGGQTAAPVPGQALEKFIGAAAGGSQAKLADLIAELEVLYWHEPREGQNGA